MNKTTTEVTTPKATLTVKPTIKVIKAERPERKEDSHD